MTDDSPTFRVVKDPAEIRAIAEGASTDLEKMYFNDLTLGALKWKHYLPIYDRLLSPRRNTRFRLLEIGIAGGGSLELWSKFFGDAAILYAIDIDLECKNKVSALPRNCHARIGSQDDPEFLKSVVSEMGGVDVVIDDGSHIAEHQLASFKTLFPLLNEGGLYICEDLHTSYWSDWQGGLRRSGTFIETVKDMIDAIHSWYGPVDNSVSGMSLHLQVPAIHIHDSMAVIEKLRIEQPTMLVK
jgi:hypothetical protein